MGILNELMGDYSGKLKSMSKEELTCEWKRWFGNRKYSEKNKYSKGSYLYQLDREYARRTLSTMWISECESAIIRHRNMEFERIELKYYRFSLDYNIMVIDMVTDINKIGKAAFYIQVEKNKITCRDNEKNILYEIKYKEYGQNELSKSKIEALAEYLRLHLKARYDQSNVDEGIELFLHEEQQDCND